MKVRVMSHWYIFQNQRMQVLEASSCNSAVLLCFHYFPYPAVGRWKKTFQSNSQTNCLQPSKSTDPELVHKVWLKKDLLWIEVWGTISLHGYLSWQCWFGDLDNTVPRRIYSCITQTRCLIVGTGMSFIAIHERWNKTKLPILNMGSCLPNHWFCTSRILLRKRDSH